MYKSPVATWVEATAGPIPEGTTPVATEDVGESSRSWQGGTVSRTRAPKDTSFPALRKRSAAEKADSPNLAWVLEQHVEHVIDERRVPGEVHVLGEEKRHLIPGDGRG